MDKAMRKLVRRVRSNAYQGKPVAPDDIMALLGHIDCLQSMVAFAKTLLSSAESCDDNTSLFPGITWTQALDTWMHIEKKL